ncbi:MAG: ABC transporter ATP-binding protein [bacterium]|nr:ABC transporter ATP-binding protein [bacterium]
MTAGDGTMLELTGLTRRFGGKTAVDGLSLLLSAGEFFALLGPNGAGKTTTVKMIAGLLRPDAGGIRIGGVDALADGVRAKSILGYVPDVPFLYDKLTVAETLDLVAAIRGLRGAGAAEAAERMLHAFDLGRERDVLAEGLSHGLKQRLVYAMALMHRPRLLLVDEPFVGLDPRSALTVKEALRGVARGGGAVLMCTHTLSAAEELADRIGILNGGRLVALGGAEDLKRAAGGAARLEEAFLRITDGA